MEVVFVSHQETQPQIRDLSAAELRHVDPDNRTLRTSFNGEACWVKYAAMHRRPFSSAVFNMMASVSNAPVFRSTHNPDGVDALRVEAQRLRELRSAGFLVPDVLQQTKDHLVLSDVGTTVSGLLQEVETPTARRAVLQVVTDHMARVHSAGQFHGRSVTKDLTLRKGGVGMIDLEHQPLAVMPLHDAQSRDIWLLFMSAATYRSEDPTLITDMTDRYAARAPQTTVDALSSNIRLLNGFTTALRTITQKTAQENMFRAVFDMNRELHLHMNG